MNIPPDVIDAMQHAYDKADCGLTDAESPMRAALSVLADSGWVVEQGWKPIETAPEDGTFLVLLESEDKTMGSRVALARWHPKIKFINGHFYFDMAEPTHWRPLPTKDTSHG